MRADRDYEPQFFNSGTVADNGTCFYHLHTHDCSGIVHIENPVVPPTPFTLGQFFDIWGEPLTTSNIAGFSGPTLVNIATCTAGVPFTCGAPSVYSGDPRAVTPAQHEQITLEVGGPFVWPPFYSWSY